MKNKLFISVLNICVFLALMVLYDVLVVKPRFDQITANSVPSRVDVELSDILNDDASDEGYNDSVLIPIQTEVDIPSLEPDYELPEDDLIPWEDLTPEEQKEIEEKMAPIDESI